MRVPDQLVALIKKVSALAATTAFLIVPTVASSAYPYHHVDDCTVCHDMYTFGGSNLYFIWETLQTPNSGPKPVVFTSFSGQNSFADGDAVYDGVCEVCHTQNAHHNNDGHDNTSHFDGETCIICHSHNREFSAPFTQSHKTHVAADKGPHLQCTDCHVDPVLDPKQFADGQNFANTAVCDTCHSPQGTYDGVNDPVIGAKGNWTNGVYTNDNLPAGKEKWCAGCHDDAPSLISGVAAPNVIGNESATTAYGVGWGFYKTGHGLPDNDVYPASGAKGAGKQCLDCHDAKTSHIDGEPRTYRFTGSYLIFNPAGSADYQNGYRLKGVATGYSGRYPMHIPRTGHVYPPGFRQTAEFALCFSCHDETALFNGGDPVTSAGAGTNFRNAIGGVWTSLHDLHTDGRNGPFGPETPQYDSDYDGVADSRISCPACHNVHGSPTPAMVRHGELISTPGTTDKVPSLGFQYTPVGTYPMLADSTGGNTRFAGGGPGNPSKNGVCNMCHNDGTTYTRPATSGTPPNAPSNVLPTAGATSVDTMPLLSASVFSDPDTTNFHQASQWQITPTAGDYTAPVYDSGASANLTFHQVPVTLNNAAAYYWRVRYRNNRGAWSDFSAETGFSTVAGPPGTVLSLNPSDVASAGPYTLSANATWSSALDGDDGDASFATLCCTSPGQSFYVNMDDPVGLGGATIQSITIYVKARYLNGPWPGAVPYAAPVDVGYRTGTATIWSGQVTTGTDGTYSLITTQTFTTDSDGGPLDLGDVSNLQVAVKRSISGPPQLRVTEIRAEIRY